MKENSDGLRELKGSVFNRKSYRIKLSNSKMNISMNINEEIESLIRREVEKTLLDNRKPLQMCFSPYC
jgi:hypothetical protein